jgi:hypothetical protein
MSIFILFLGSVAHAVGLYINGVRVDGVSNVKLKSVDVEIDANGDVRISAKGYNVNIAEPVKPPPPPPKNVAPQPTRYILTMTANGDPQWDIDVYVGGVFVKRFQSGQPAGPIDVTRFIHPGDNSLRFKAVKQEGIIHSTQPNEIVQLSLDADQALLTGKHEVTHVYSYKRTAAETGLYDESVNVQIR